MFGGLHLSCFYETHHIFWLSSTMTRHILNVKT